MGFWNCNFSKFNQAFFGKDSSSARKKTMDDVIFEIFWVFECCMVGGLGKHYVHKQNGSLSGLWPYVVNFDRMMISDWML